MVVIVIKKRGHSLPIHIIVAEEFKRRILPPEKVRVQKNSLHAQQIAKMALAAKRKEPLRVPFRDIKSLVRSAKKCNEKKSAFQSAGKPRFTIHVAAPRAPSLQATGQVVKFTNCRVYSATGGLVHDDIWVRNGRLIDPVGFVNLKLRASKLFKACVLFSATVSPPTHIAHTRFFLQMSRFWEAASMSAYACDVIVDCGGLILSPGFIDVQINGAFGVDFSDTSITTEQIQGICSQMLSSGVTSICPTIVSSSPETYAVCIEKIRQLRAKLQELDAAVTAAVINRTPLAESVVDTSSSYPPGARLLGLHLEGPFINVDKKGAHAQHNLREPSEGMRSLRDTYGDVDWSGGEASIVTLAPELAGALKTAHALSSRGVVTSIGHTSADIRTADAAVHAGCTLITHLYNAMSSFHHRDPGVVGLLGRMHGGVKPKHIRRLSRQGSASEMGGLLYSPVKDRAAGAGNVGGGSENGGLIGTPGGFRDNNNSNSSNSSNRSSADGTPAPPELGGDGGPFSDGGAGFLGGLDDMPPLTLPQSVTLHEEGFIVPSTTAVALASAASSSHGAIGGATGTDVSGGTSLLEADGRRHSIHESTLTAGQVPEVRLYDPFGSTMSSGVVAVGSSHSLPRRLDFDSNSTADAAAAAALTASSPSHTASASSSHHNEAGDGVALAHAGSSGSRHSAGSSSGNGVAGSSISSLGSSSSIANNNSTAATTVTSHGPLVRASSGLNLRRLGSGGVFLDRLSSSSTPNAVNAGGSTPSPLNLNGSSSANAKPLVASSTVTSGGQQQGATGHSGGGIITPFTQVPAPSSSNTAAGKQRPPLSDSHGRPYYSIIVDCVHCHPYAVCTAMRTHPGGLILVTDAMKAMGLPVGRHTLGE